MADDFSYSAALFGPDRDAVEGGGRFADARLVPAAGGGYAAEIFTKVGQESQPKPTDKDLTYDYDKTLGFKQQAVGSFASDDNEWVRHAAKSLYPEEPLERSVHRFGKTKEGRYFHKGDDGKMYEVTPPRGFGRLANIGGGVGHALPVGGGTAAGIATAPMAVTGVGMLGTMGAAGGGAVGGELLRQKIGDYILGEASTNEVNIPKVAYEGAQSALGQGVGAGMGAWIQRHAVPDIGRYSAPVTNRLMDQADNIGVRLTPAEASGLESLVAQQKILNSVPQSANIMKDFTRERNQEVYGAYRNFLNALGRPRDAAALGRQGAEVSEGIVDAAQRLRTNAVDPLYRQAEREIGFISPRAAHEYIEQQMPTAKGSIRRALEVAQRELGRTGTEASDASFRGLNNAKQAIDLLLENEDIALKQGIDRSAHSALRAVRERLVAAMDNAAGNSGAYARGRQVYGDLSENLVNPTQEALAPLLNAGRANANLVQTAQALLDPARRSPEQITQARRLIERQDPALWNSFVRQFMQQETANALKTMASGEMRNVGGGISKALSSEPMLDNLRAAMNPRQFREFTDIMDVFRATARAVDANSDTAFKQQMIQRAKNAAGGGIARTIRNVNLLKAVENTADWFANRNYERQAEAIANIITSGDRQAIMRLRQIRQLEPNDWRRFAVIGEVLTRGGALGAEEALGD
jgi:hypothetical protein